MQQTVQCTGKARARRDVWASCLRWLAAACLAIGTMGPAWAACPSIVNLTVAAGGTVAIPCAQQWGFLEVDPATTYPTDYGHVNVIPGWTYAPQYVNTSGAGQTDSFYLTDGETGAGIGDPNARVHLIITILPTGLTVNPATLPAATVGTFYTQTFTASGGTTPYHYAATTTLPAGLSLDNSTGVLNGIPTATGSTSITVKATDANNVSGTVSPTLVVNAGVPGKPTITGATATTSGGLPAASIAFSTPPDNGSAITGYTVTASPSNATYTGTGSPILATNLTAGTTYTFTVKATNGVGPGPASDPSAGVIAKRDQTIAFANPGTQNFGTTPTLTATATSGLMPTFSSSTTSVCTVTSGGTLTFGSTGICSITASQSGDGSYFAAPDVSQQFSVAAVAPGAPTIGTATAGNAQAEVSFTAPASNGGAAITGYTVTSDNGITATGTGSPITVTGLQNGTAYTFTVTATNAASITGSPSAASNQVTPTAPQTIGGFSATPGAPVFTQGGTFAVAATASSGLPVSFGITSASSSVCSIAGSTVTMLSPGTCSVTADQAGNAAYQPAPQQTLAVVISAPPPPVAGPVNATVGYSSSANTITPVITGGTADTIAVTPATHGTATVNGLNIVYTPTVGYSGNDSFAYTASNAGGTSAPAMVTVQVSNPSITISTSAPLTANVGSTYSQTFTWSGGNAPYAHYSVDNLPAGLGITGSTADSVTISGTPTAAGTFNLIASARDSSTGNGPFTTGQLFTLTVNAPALALSPAGGTLAGSYGNAYSQAFGASGGTAPYGYSLIGTLPAGLSFDAATGSISGTPTQTGSFPISVTAIDSSTGTGAPFSVSNSYTLQISAATITLTPTTLPNGTVGTAYPAASFGASGGIGPYSYAAGTLPAGMVLSAGQLAGTPTEAGSFSVTVTATDAHGQTGSHVYNFNIGAPVLTLAPASLPNATAETAYSQTLGASGGTAPYSYAFTGNLPTGITFDSSTGTLSGTATVSGDFSFTVKATDSSTGAGAPFSVMQNYTLHIDAPTVTVTPATLPAAIAGTAYPTTALSASGGAGPYSYALTGTLPAGLGFDAGTATFAGTPTETGSFTFAVTATDAHGFTGTANYTLAVSTGTLSLAPGSLPDATAETAYSQVLAASGGVAPYAYTVANGSLPAGLSLDSGTGTLSGTPTVSGDFSVDIKATDSSTGTGAPASVTKTYALHVAAPVLTLTPASLADGTVGVAYSAATLSASGGIGPYTYVLTGTLPAGMSFNAGTATLSGTPSAAGSFPLTATATDAHGFTATAHYTLKIAAATLTLDPASLPNATAETAYSQTISAHGGTAPYGYAVTGTLPTGITLDGGTGTLSGTATVSGDFSFTIKATDSSTGIGAPFSATQNYTLHVVAPALTLAPASLADGTVGVAYPSETLAASGGVGPYTYALTGTLPAGMSFNAGTATLSGTPSAAGSFPLTATATDAHGFTATAHYTLKIAAATLTLDPASLPNATAETAYSQTISAHGGTAPYSYAVTGTLPTGITLDGGTGTLSGTATVSGDFSFTIKATDSSTGIGAPFSATQNYTLHVVAPTVTVTPASLPAATAGTPYPTATFGASGGVAPYSYALNGTLPAGLSFNVGSGTVAGTPTETGNFAFVVTATDAHGFTGTANYTLAVASATLSLAPGSLPDATAEAAYSQVLTASGGVAPYAYTVANGALPAGLSLDSGTGTLSGTPTVSGNFSVGIKATDSSTGTGSPASITKTYTLAVAAPVITITPASLPAAQQAEVYSQALSASGGNGSYGYAVTSGALPAGLSLSGSGLLSGTPTVSGSFSFTVTATDGLHFTGAQAYTLAIGVAKPVAKDDTASTPANQAVTIAVTENDSGPIASIAVAKAPTHGTAAVSGLDVVYTPASNFFGTDTLTYTATGPGGTSAPATVTVTVTPLAVPTAAAQTATTLAGKAVTIHATQGASGGPFTAVAIASNPSSGTAAVSGQDIVYTPTIDASGPVSFTYTLSNPFGVSQPATVTVQVNPVPQVVAQTVDALAGTTVRVDLTRQARGGPFTGAALLSISPASAGTGSIVKDGDVYRLDFAAAATYAGAVQIRFTLSNAYATSAPGTITVNVTARPDPSKDAEVLGILGAQADATRRFALGQIDNFQRRLESLHGEGGTAGFSNGLSFISGSGSRHRAGDFAARGNDPFGDGLQRRYLVQPEAAQQDAQDASSAGRQPGDIAFWTGGAVNFGSQQVGGSSNGIDFTTSGISIGADKRLSPAFALGAGLGYGHDASDVGHKGSRSTADSYNVAAYASYRPSESTYLDGLVGYQWLSFDARRYVTANGNRVNGSRDGKQWFGSLSAGYEHRGEHLLLSPYGRLDMASATLDGYTEHGDAVYALHYDEQKVKTTTGSLGMRLNYPLKRDFGMLSPQLRVEYRHDFQGSSTAVMRYADLMSGPFYRATVDGQSRNHALLGLGLQMQTWRGLMFRVEYQNLFDNSSDHNQSIQLGLEAPFNP